MKNRIIFIAVVGGLIVSNTYFALKAGSLGGELAAAKKEISSFHRNEKVINFSRLFIDSVLKSGNEVDFDTRLKLENAIRDIKDDEILAQWDKFVKSKTEAEAQDEVKDLLDLLMKKIQ
ncbi:MAG: hypothetical protein HW401_423 [Parcubacteria group bacterium]|nr:hypothetical protein [Parcubacteria group bacterium]